SIFRAVGGERAAQVSAHHHGGRAAVVDGAGELEDGVGRRGEALGCVVDPFDENDRELEAPARSVPGVGLDDVDVVDAPGGLHRRGHLGVAAAAGAALAAAATLEADVG